MLLLKSGDVSCGASAAAVWSADPFQSQWLFMDVNPYTIILCSAIGWMGKWQLTNDLKTKQYNLILNSLIFTLL